MDIVIMWYVILLEGDIPVQGLPISTITPKRLPLSQKSKLTYYHLTLSVIFNNDDDDDDDDNDNEY